ncbi:methyl-accepting chemotaxis protein [Leadbettera azotonutricia]|uniref:Methyl-accepting chemotaxis protein DmcB n=1 Tax=Leadbettera azotonutricia (strain ATCC BAA-888 / DSM 13862 / ZAS-9) TaxID=545695 RepID=F5YEI7_LEAAZ|nr:methyl-accepting chemotaxis protein [Leadbettera azotonutricia]AEF82901.1 methyl-accepting chemotaxis protein DmcB [Leadbettera azotonutricia ZAS-9]
MALEKKKRTFSILFKIAGVASGLVLITIIILAIFSIRDLQKISLETATTIARSKLSGDINALQDVIDLEYGRLRMQDGKLCDSDGKPLDGRTELIDDISKDLGVVATIFVKEGNDFKRITTSIVDDTGKRAVGTMLGTGSAAYGPITRGESYVGNAAILGKAYLAAYHPVFTTGETGNAGDIIGVYFIGFELSEVQDLINTGTRTGVIQIVIISVILLVVSVILNLSLFKGIIVNPINKIVAQLQQVSEGNLTLKLDIKSNDEFGNMAIYSNRMVENMKSLVGSIVTQSNKLLEIGTSLASSMNQTAAAIHEITSNTESMKTQVVNQAVSVDQSSTSMEEITKNIEELNGHIGRQTGDIERSSAAVEEMLANISSVTRTLNTNMDNVQELAAASENGHTSIIEVSQDIQEIAKNSEGLKEINSVIANIASQTNLLSMNAAIEAAHAGESGRGFAVVADEIRKLAESSNVQAKTVSQVLKKIQASIQKITVSTNDVLIKFGNMAEDIKTVTNQEEQVKAAMEEQNAGSKQILDAIGGLHDKNQSVKSGSTVMLAKSAEVIEESKKLEMITSEITTGMDEMAAGAREINQAVQEVNKISLENRESIQALIAEVTKFKV